jgi:hypothetical protein
MRVLLPTHDSPGGAEPLVGLAAQLRALGAEVRMCAPPDCAERLIRTDGAAVAATLPLDVVSRDKAAGIRMTPSAQRLPATSERS